MFSKFRESRTKRLAARRLDDGSQLCVGDDYEEIAALVDRYVVHDRNWYRHRARVVRRWFRLFGVGVIVLSASLPVIAAVDFKDSQFVITLVSVLVAALTALRTFFQWDGQWRVLKVADWKLTALLGAWEADVCSLNGQAPARTEVSKRTRLLLDEAGKVIDSEASSFFTAVTWPETGGSSSGKQP
jgi:hypothetical protein